MTLSERIAYIKGLADGLNLDETKAEVKVINEMLSLLEDMVVSVNNVEELYDELSEQVDEIDGDLAIVEEDLYDDCDCDCGCDCNCDCDDCGCDCDCDCDEYAEDEENPLYEVTCPDCETEIVVDEDMLLEGEILCPECGNSLEFDFTGLFGEDGCSCGNSDCEDCIEF